MSRETFELLLAPHLPWVRSFVGRQLRSSDHIEDLAQQTLLRAFLSRNQLRCAAKFRNWLWSIALNEVRAFLRGLQPTASIDEPRNFQLPDAGPQSPFALCERKEQEDWLRAAIARLPRRDRNAIRLVDLEGLSYQEAAVVLEVSAPAFKSIHFRARQRLGRALGAPQKPEPERLPAAA